MDIISRPRAIGEQELGLLNYKEFKVILDADVAPPVSGYGRVPLILAGCIIFQQHGCE